jgi:multidrug resistance efflux pump
MWSSGRSRLMHKIGRLVIGLGLILLGEQVFAADEVKATTAQGQIVLTGKLSCSLKRHVHMPFRGVITSLNVRCGQRVEKGAVLAQYDLHPEDVLKLHRRLSRFHIKELEIRLEGVEHTLGNLEGKLLKISKLAAEIKRAELKKELVSLEEKKEELKSLTENKMAPEKSLNKVNREIRLLRKKYKLLQESLPLERKGLNRKISLLREKRKLLRERLPQERALERKDRAVLGDLLGSPVGSADTPKKGVLKAPMSGHVIWVNPELRTGAELGRTRPIIVAVMDPMLVRASVHEIEALQLKLGDRADLVLEAVKGKKFIAKVSRISWASLTPQLDRPSYYEVEFVVPNPEFLLREGLKGRITLHKRK